VRYEYKLLNVPADEAEAVVNQLAAEGWELLEGKETLFVQKDVWMARLWFKRAIYGEVGLDFSL